MFGKGAACMMASIVGSVPAGCIPTVARQLQRCRGGVRLSTTVVNARLLKGKKALSARLDTSSTLRDRTTRN